MQRHNSIEGLSHWSETIHVCAYCSCPHLHPFLRDLHLIRDLLSISPLANKFHLQDASEQLSCQKNYVCSSSLLSPLSLSEAFSFDPLTEQSLNSLGFERCPIYKLRNISLEKLTIGLIRTVKAAVV